MIGETLKSLKKAHEREINNVHSPLPPMKMPRNDEPDIVFSERDSCNIRQPHDDPLVIMLRVEEFNIHQVLIDNRSSTDIIYLPMFQQMKLDKKRIKPFTSSQVSFTGDRIVPKGIITLTIIAGTYPAQVTKEIDFLIVDCPSTYTQQANSSDDNILLEGEISNNAWRRRNQRRSSSGKNVLPSYLSIWGEPHMGDQ